MVKIAIDVPKKMLELAQNSQTKEMPYNLCLECPFIKDTCDGPNCLAMTNERWVEWANTRAKQLNLTRAQISDMSGIPQGTVSNVMSGRTADIRHSTMREITKVLIGGCWGQYPCHFASLLMTANLPEDDPDAQKLDALKSELETAKVTIASLREQIDQAEEKHTKAIQEVKEEAQRKVDFLKDQIAFKDAQIRERTESIHKKEKLTVRLGFILGFIIFVIVAILIYDKLNPNVGWFRDAGAYWTGDMAASVYHVYIPFGKWAL